MGLGDWLITKITSHLSKDVDKPRAYLCDFDRICQEARTGDVLLIEGRNRISHIIQRITLSPWSHAALYIGRIHDIEEPKLRELIHRNYKGPANKRLIIESLPGKGTLISPIEVHIKEHIRMCRPTGLSYKDAQKVVAEAMNSLGKNYNIRHLLDLGRFLIKSRFIPYRWRSSLFGYNPGQATQDICSVMIARAFDSIRFPILPLIRESEKKNLEVIGRNPNLFAPSDFDYSPYFNIIKYPIFPVSDAPVYRNLPWRDELVSNDEFGISHKDTLNPTDRLDLD